MPDKSEQWDVSPDGADLDGTTEIEHREAEQNKRETAPEPPVPATDTRGHAETVE
jgi:hypothetical protein